MKTFFGVLLGTIVALLVIVGLFFFMSGANLAAWSFFGPRVVQVQRDITESSKSFIDSTNAAAGNVVAEHAGVMTNFTASMTAGNDALAESYSSQARALRFQVCTMIQPLAPEDWSLMVREFVSSGACAVFNGTVNISVK